MVRKREVQAAKSWADLPDPSQYHPMSGEPIWDEAAVRAVLARVGAVRDQALQDAMSELEERRRLLHSQFEALDIREADAVYGFSIDAIRALKGTPAAAADALPLTSPLRQHIAWVHSVMREAGHCIDGGVCHHNCRPKPEAPCFRQKACLPMTGSRLNDDWTLPAPQSSANPGPLAAVEPSDTEGRQLALLREGAALMPLGSKRRAEWVLKVGAHRAAIAASKEGASHGQ